MNKVVLYHANCLDGAGAAWAFWRRYGDDGVTYIPCQYGNTLPDGMAGTMVFMLDFSAKREQIIDMCAVADSVVIIDHHKTAEADLADLDAKNLTVLFNQDRSGAFLTWQYLFGDELPPMFLRHIEDRDLWRFRYRGTKDACAGMKLYGDFRDLGAVESLEGLTRATENGRAINAFLQQRIDEVLAGDPEFTEHGAPVYNIPGFMISETLHHALDKHPCAPYAAAYFDLPGKRVFSLRSTDDRDDVSAIASERGGGGHRNAAGFTTTPDLTPAEILP